MAADPISGGIEAGVGLLGGILGQIFSAGNRSQAAEAMRRASRAFNIPLPVLQQMVAEQMGPSAFNDVRADPELQAAQSQALGELGNISDSGGLTLTDKVNNNELQRQAAQKSQAQRQSIVNVLRKTSGSQPAVEAALQLGAIAPAQQARADAAARTAADARARATQAVLDKARLAGSMRSQDIGEQSQRAEAADRIAQYNAAAKERAQRYNLGIPQQQYVNQMQRAGGQANVQQAYAQQQSGEANRVGSMWADIGSGAGKAFGGIYDAFGRKKKPDEDEG